MDRHSFYHTATKYMVNQLTTTAIHVQEDQACQVIRRPAKKLPQRIRQDDLG